MQLKSWSKFLAPLLLVLALAACEDSEERAERHYQSGLALLEEGETEKALVEFRNVFNLNGAHRDARATYARIVREKGRFREAFGQYLRLVEQYPDDLEGRIALSELSYQTNNWNEFERHSEAAIAAAPEDPAVKIIATARDYRQAVIDEDEDARLAAFEDVIALSESAQGNKILQRALVDGHIRNQDYDSALDVVDVSLETEPRNRDLHTMKLSILAQLQNNQGLEDHLREMTVIFPDDPSAKETFVRYLMSQGEGDKAEAYLREIADPAAEDPGFFLTLVQFVGQTRGRDAAMAELEKAIAEVPDPSPYQALVASMEFESGNRDEAIAQIEQIIADNESSDQLRRIKVTLARMLLSTGNEVGAQRLVAEVLDEDPSQVDALRLSAAWQIESDETDAAINTLRTALDQEPQDVESMNLMADAYLRAGNNELALEFLSLAVDASGQAPSQSIRLSRFLANDGRNIAAERALVASLRLNDGNEALLGELGRIYLVMEDYGRAGDVIRALRETGSASAIRTAASLEAAVIERQSGTDAAIAFLEELSTDLGGDIASAFTIIRAKIASGDSEGAMEDMDELLAANPDSTQVKFLAATTKAATGDLESAEADYRALLAQEPNQPRLWLELIRVVNVQGRGDDARDVLTEALAANPGAPDLLWANASYLEQDGKFEEAIGVYEELYEQNSQSLIVANNLASLLSTYRDDEESLARAEVVSRRLRNTNQPAFQDTYGWIAFRNNNLTDALTKLEPAAAGLPNDPVVQYHLGEVYLALERTDEAKAQFEKAVSLAGAADQRAPIQAAREKLDTLQ